MLVDRLDQMLEQLQFNHYAELKYVHIRISKIISRSYQSCVRLRSFAVRQHAGKAVGLQLEL